MELLTHAPERRVLVRRILELDHPERQPVHERHDVRPPLVPVFGDGELADREPVVVGAIVEIDRDGLLALNPTVVSAVFDRHPVRQQPVEGAAARVRCRPFRAHQLAKGIVKRRSGKLGIESSQGIADPPFQRDIAIIGAFRTQRIGAVGDAPVEAQELGERVVLDDGFGDAAHPAGSASRLMMRRIISSLPAGACSATNRGSAVKIWRLSPFTAPSRFR